MDNIAVEQRFYYLKDLWLLREKAFIVQESS